LYKKASPYRVGLFCGCLKSDDGPLERHVSKIRGRANAKPLMQYKKPLVPKRLGFFYWAQKSMG
jgi:hypothetical protein